MTRRERKKLEFYAWYAFDFRADTQHLTCNERAAYRDILDEIFITNQSGGCLPDDDQYLARVVQRSLDEWKGMRYVLVDGPRPLLKKRGARIYSERLIGEIEKAQLKAEKYRQNALSNGPATAGRGSAIVEPSLSDPIQSASVSKSSSHSRLSSSGGGNGNHEVTDANFAELWAVYPNKDGRKEALRHFRASVKTAEDLASIGAALQKYLGHLTVNPWKRAKNGSTWFGNWRDWENWTEPQSGEAPIPARAVTDRERGIDDAREWIGEQRDLIAIWNRRGSVSADWPVAGCTPAEWEAYFASVKENGVMSLDEWRNQEKR